jgi:hypothetical protein
LQGSPYEVQGVFDCSYNKLKTLEYSPIKTQWFNASHNDLEELRTTTEEINGNFYCDNNPNLKKLNGNLRLITGNVYFNGCDSLTESEILKFMTQCKIEGKVFKNHKQITF